MTTRSTSREVAERIMAVLPENYLVTVIPLKEGEYSASGMECIEKKPSSEGLAYLYMTLDQVTSGIEGWIEGMLAERLGDEGLASIKDIKRGTGEEDNTEPSGSENESNLSRA
jgi:hypothetical protein